MTPLARLLNEEKGLIERFIEVLLQEQAALRSGKAEDLGPISEEKIALVGALNETESRRGQLIEKADRAGMTRWLAAHPEERVAAGVWAQVLKLAGEAKQHHELNGQLITLHLKRTNEALAVLTHRSDNAKLYGSDGQATGGSGSRIVDSA